MKFLETRRGVVIVTAPILLAIVLWVVFGLSVTRTTGSSNLPALKDSELLILAKPFGSVQRGQFILFRAYTRDYPTYYIKRIIGMPGDSIALVKGIFTINGKLLEEKDVVNYWKAQGSFDDCSYLANSDFWNFQPPNPLLPESPCGQTFAANYKPKPFVIPKDEYFVVGDNRSPGGSEDSRAFGTVKKADIRSVVWFVGFPPRKLELPTEFR